MTIKAVKNYILTAFLIFRGGMRGSPSGADGQERDWCSCQKGTKGAPHKAEGDIIKGSKGVKSAVDSWLVFMIPFVHVQTIKNPIPGCLVSRNESWQTW